MDLLSDARVPVGLLEHTEVRAVPRHAVPFPTHSAVCPQPEARAEEQGSPWLKLASCWQLAYTHWLWLKQNQGNF